MGKPEISSGYGRSVAQSRCPQCKGCRMTVPASGARLVTVGQAVGPGPGASGERIHGLNQSRDMSYFALIWRKGRSFKVNLTRRLMAGRRSSCGGVADLESGTRRQKLSAAEHSCGVRDAGRCILPPGPPIPSLEADATHNLRCSSRSGAEDLTCL